MHEKDVLAMLERKDIPIELKLQYFEYMETIEDIKIKQTKGSEQGLERLEKKEILAAENRA